MKGSNWKNESEENGFKKLTKSIAITSDTSDHNSFQLIQKIIMVVTVDGW